MSEKGSRHHHGRTARTSELIATLIEQLPQDARRARRTARELQRLYSPTADRVRKALDRVPGESLRAKGERIGIPGGSVWALWHGKYQPTAEIMALIEAAARKTEDAE